MKNTYLLTFSGWLAGLVLLLCTTTTLFSQTRTWTGASGTDWNNPSNWNFSYPPSVPNQFSDVIIPNVANKPVISSLNVAVASVVIQPGGELTIASSSQLTVNSPSWGGTAEVAIYNEGILTNNGTIYSDAVTMDDGIMNLGTLNNNTGAAITVDRTYYRGLFNYYGTINNSGTINTGTSANGWMNIGLVNYGAFNNTTGTINIEHSSSIGLANLSGTFTNQATINIGATASVGTIGIINHSGGNILNNPGGLININRSSQHGIKNFSGGTFTNAATINIGSLAAVGNNGILNEYFFNNNAGGVININNSAQYGIRNGDNGTFTNAATINIGSLAAVGGYGIGNEFIFNNNTGGQINIDRSSVCGLLNDYGIFNNAAVITIGGTASPGEQGLTTFNLSTFNNTGSISIERSTTHGVWNSGTFNNSSTVTVGNNAATSMTYTLLNDGTFTNDTGGAIHLNRATDSGILNYTSFTNKATINIGSAASVGSNGVLNQGTFSNNTGGQLNLNRSTNSGIVNAAGTFTNSATINIGSSAAIGIYGLVNQATFSNSGSGQIKIDRSTTVGLWNSAGTFTNAATLNIGSIAAVGVKCIYNQATINNNTGGTIIANNSTEYGIENFTGTFTNAATINIGSTAAVGTNGLRNAATFNNNAGGQINLDRSTSSALLNAAGTFSNVATVTIGNNTASAMTYGIENAVAFTNSGSGLIKIDRTTSGGIWNQSTGTFTNSATLNIGSLAAIGQRCIYNSGTFNNNTGGIINANNASLYGIEHISGTFTNAATINIGSTATAGTYGLRNSSTFNNNTGGTIKIDRSTSFGLRNNAGTFTNAATLTIGSLVAVGTTGISNAATITNSASGTINIDRSTTRGIINVTGTFTNAGFLNIGALVASSISYGIENDAAFANNGSGQININRSTTYGIWNDAGTFTNAATLNIGSTAAVGTRCIYNENTFSNNTGGTINANNASQYGIEHVAGTFTNAATINIGSLSAVGTNGLRNAATFNNNTGGQLNLDRSTGSALLNAAGTFTNVATVTIGNNAASAMTYGIENAVAFTNSSSGLIKIDRTTSGGIWNQSTGTFTNSATLNIGSLAAIGQRCIYNTGTFNNNTGGVVNANNASLYGIEHVTGTFTNAATINIGSTATAGSYGLRNSSTFNNNTGGQIKIDRCTSFGLRNNAGTFTNAATVNIGSLVAVGTTGISNAATITNSASGTINIDRATIRGIINVTGTITNAGILNIGALAASSMSYGIENDAAFANNGSGQININRSTTYGIWNDAGTFTNAATLNIGSTAAVGTRCIYNENTFSNNTGGTINANNASQYGIEHVTGTFTNAATINIGSLSAVGTNGLRNAAIFNNNAGGQLNLDRSTGSALLNAAGTFTNAATVTIGNNAASEMTYGIENTATFGNNASGQLNINRTTASGIYASAGTFTNQGNITIGALAPVTHLVTANTGTYSNVSGGTLKGTGNLAAANFANAGGTLSPGYSPGKMTFTGDEDFVNNTLIMEVNGTGMAGVDFDQVVVNGAATLGGTLALSINYVPVSGDQVTILSATAISGTFSNVTGLPVDWQVVYTANSVVLTFGTVLPVELTEFSAHLLDQTVQLDWHTASEHNNEGFFIERSSDAGQWEDIGFVPGHGTTAEPNIYSFLDVNPFYPVTGGCNGGCVNYYRLRQVDFGGLFDYSDIVSVELTGQEGRPVLFPNPASTEVQVQLPLEFTEGKLAMFDEAGRLVLMQELAARSQTVRLATADLVAGIYFCQIQLDGAVFVERLLIW